MKKILISLILAVVMILSIGGSALAWDPSDAEVYVVIEEPVVTGVYLGGNLVDSGLVTVSGVVTVTASAEAYNMFLSQEHASASGEAGYTVSGPAVSTSGTDGAYNSDSGWRGADASVDIDFSWSHTFVPWAGMNLPPTTYNVYQYGSAEAEAFLEFLGISWLEYGYISDSGSDSLASSFTVHRTPDPDYNPYEGCEGQLMVGSPTQWEAYNWVDQAATPQVLAEDVDFSWEQSGNTYRLEIPAGTEMSIPNYHDVSCLFYEKGRFSPSYMELSQPAIFTVNGEPITFTSVVGGQAQ